jgi:drug/metabolite transporter (DMT)-like permease
MRPISPNPISIRQRLKSDGLLLFVSAVLGSGFVAQSIASASMSNYLFNGMRFALAMLLLLIFTRFRWNATREQWRWVLLAGFFLFMGSTFQQIGLETTSAANAGFITGLYVVIIPIILFTLRMAKIHWLTWAAATIAVIGTLLLSTGGAFQPAIGDLYELIGAFLWAGHVIVVGLASRKMENFQFTIGQFGVVALLNLLGALFFVRGQNPLPAEAWYATLFSAVFPVGLGFTLQVVGQRSAPTTDAAIIFSMEAVFSAIFGFFFLREALLPIQIVGCILIFCAIILAQFQPHSETPAPAEPAAILQE